MAIKTIDESQRKAARVAGLAGLVTMAIVVFANFGIQARLVVPNNAAESKLSAATRSIACKT